MIKLTLDTKGFDRDLEKFAKKNHRDFKKAVGDATVKMHFLAVMVFAPHVTGNLKKLIKMFIIGNGLTGDVISNANYSKAVEEGTKPHTITAKGKKVLAGPASKAPPGWKNISGDYAIYGKSVKHPGTQPHPFMMPAFMQAKRLFYSLLEKAL